MVLLLLLHIDCARSNQRKQSTTTTPQLQQQTTATSSDNYFDERNWFLITWLLCYTTSLQDTLPTELPYYLTTTHPRAGQPIQHKNNYNDNYAMVCAALYSSIPIQQQLQRHPCPRQPIQHNNPSLRLPTEQFICRVTHDCIPWACDSIALLHGHDTLPIIESLLAQTTNYLIIYSLFTTYCLLTFYDCTTATYCGWFIELLNDWVTQIHTEAHKKHTHCKYAILLLLLVSLYPCSLVPLHPMRHRPSLYERSITIPLPPAAAVRARAEAGTPEEEEGEEGRGRLRDSRIAASNPPSSLSTPSS